MSEVEAPRPRSTDTLLYPAFKSKDEGWVIVWESTNEDGTPTSYAEYYKSIYDARIAIAKAGQ